MIDTNQEMDFLKKVLRERFSFFLEEDSSLQLKINGYLIEDVRSIREDDLITLEQVQSLKPLSLHPQLSRIPDLTEEEPVFFSFIQKGHSSFNKIDDSEFLSIHQDQSYETIPSKKIIIDERLTNDFDSSNQIHTTTYSPKEEQKSTAI